MKFNRGTRKDEDLIDIYRDLTLPRRVEEKMLIYLRQGKISKWFSGWGQEAISVGCAKALNAEEYIMTMHRNLGVFTTRNVPLDRLFGQFQGKLTGFTKGRDRSFHFGTNEHHIAGMISHLGPQLGVACGIALAEKLSGSGRCALAFTGDGGASEGDFHEALNVAAVWDLPVIFVIENNHWGLSTPSNEQFRCKAFIDKGIGYGMEAISVNGNNVLEVYDTIKKVKSEIQKSPKPFLIECNTFRLRGHEEASGTKYYPEGIKDEWEKKDPISNFQNFLVEQNALTQEQIEEIKAEQIKHIETCFNQALAELPVEFDKEIEYTDLFKEPSNSTSTAESSDQTELRFIDAIANALDSAMTKHENLILMGQDIADYGGVFKATEGLLSKFGKDRVRNTPLCESAILGTGLGLSIRGYKSMVEMQFADFVSCGFNQIVNNLAKIHWRWGQNADVVIRMPTGAGVGAGPFHSQSNEAWFFHIPGLKILYPSSPIDAKGLLLAAFEDPNPVLFFEHKNLYRSLSEPVPDNYYTIEIGRAKQVRSGNDLSIITYGLGVHWATEVTSNMDLDADIIDLRSLAPLDFDAISTSVKKTGRVLILHEDTLTGGIGGELSATISKDLFEFLDAPVHRCASLDTPVPFASELEEHFLAKKRLEETLKALIEY